MHSRGPDPAFYVVRVMGQVQSCLDDRAEADIGQKMLRHEHGNNHDQFANGDGSREDLVHAGARHSARVDHTVARTSQGYLSPLEKKDDLIDDGQPGW